VAAKDFADVYDALMYAFERQANRRNLTQGEILRAATALHDKTKDARDGSGRGAEILAKKLGVAASTVYRAKKIHLAAGEEDLKAVQEGKATINSVYRKIKERDEKKTAFRPGGLFAKIIAYLGVTRHAEAARALIEEFVAPEERESFYGTLPADGGEVENDNVQC
jgi:hypothetical protein